MSRLPLRRRLSPRLHSVLQRARRLAYWPRLLLGRAAGSYAYHTTVDAPAPPRLDLYLPVDENGPSAEDARAWCARQTLPGLRVVAYERDPREGARVHYRVDRDGIVPDQDASGEHVSDKHVSGEHVPGEEAPFFAAPQTLDSPYPGFHDNALSVLRYETIDAVVMTDRVEAPGPTRLARADDVLESPWRRLTVFRTEAYRHDPVTDAVVPRSARAVVKAVIGEAIHELPRDNETFHRLRRGPYFGRRSLPPMLEIGLRGTPPVATAGDQDTRPTVIVTLSYLAQGGVEHVLFETLWALRARFRFVIVTLAPHRRALGDRRATFAQLTDHLYALGDLLHPAAMYPMLLELIDRFSATTLFNTNGTTFFYEHVASLRRDRPALRILDQLYDHRAGYITWYDEAVRSSVDACIGVNRRIARTLVDDYALHPEQAPMIWPCGRRSEAFPRSEDALRIRRRLRTELGYGADDVVLLTAARLDAQKRPLDLVALAERLVDVPEIRFLWVGGGVLEDAFVHAIDDAGLANVRRLPFRDDIPDLVVMADAGCLVSQFEGLPVFMMECFQGGRPVLGTDVGDMGEVLRETGGGIVVDQPGDIDALERGVRRLVDPATRASYADRARDAASLFAIEACAERYSDLFAGTS